ncbi:hypothetical protein BOTCAL_0167g00170 [Botryotinia calthae]|uniref:Uncharacterized protein n=1 Tax=Botryotinia calthae TaxID=38488 RepID=A0A4Y8D1Y5_9HELO|nr:hypothetical protein BOTCAL_0167g00170 [Botryotinia calthae]
MQANGYTEKDKEVFAKNMAKNMAKDMAKNMAEWKLLRISNVATGLFFIFFILSTLTFGQ